MFSARFSGVSQEITVPIGAVRAIYAKENGRGLAFEDEAVETAEVLPDTPPTEMRSSTEPKTKSPPRLTIVK